MMKRFSRLFFIFLFLSSVMQLNTSPTLAIAASPALHKDNWQQRRYTFLSKNSMFGGELKDEVVSEQGTDIEQRYSHENCSICIVWMI